MKTAVVTTFPLNYPTWREMLSSFDEHWDKDVDLLISLDKVSQAEFDATQTEINQLMPSGRQFFLSNEWSKDKEDFFNRNTDSPDLPYRFHVCRFSHKVFALFAALQHCRDGYDSIIWLDADVITHKQLINFTYKDAATLQRIDAPHSECSFIEFNLQKRGGEIIEAMHDYYITDKVLELNGWTDCDVFDAVAKDYDIENLSEGLQGWHVFPESKLGQYMEHRKGARKMQKQPAQAVYDSSNLNIKTKNCLPNETIKDNIRQNLALIKNWVEYVKPHDEPVVVCSAGTSLSYNEIKAWHDKGVKIVTVKHAIDRLKEWDIKPWACVLLDPRPHVENFVKKPDRDVIYFVASMVDPSVVKTLLDNDCKVVGYHAFVGAGEERLLQQGTMLVAGGSGTATRCIGLLHECLGFKDFHCYGYDLSYPTRPDMNIKNEDGNPKYMEITLSAMSWGNKPQTKTFWTEGQFLAQAKELHDLYKSDLGFKIQLYGSGIAGWQQDHYNQYKVWLERYNAKIEQKKQNASGLNEWQYRIRS